MRNIEFALTGRPPKAVFEQIRAFLRVGARHQRRSLGIEPQGKNFLPFGSIFHDIAAIGIAADRLGIAPEAELRAIFLQRAEPALFGELEQAGGRGST